MEAKVYGDRICRQCKGLCHDGSWRQAWAVRAGYWCCESHLRAWEEGRLQEHIRASFAREKLPMPQDASKYGYTDAAWSELKQRYYEPVDVVRK